MRNVLLIILAVIFINCDPNRIYEMNEEFKNGVWHADSVPIFSFNIPEEGKYDVFMNIRNTSSYPYQNIYVTYFLEDTLGQLLKKELVNFDLFHPKTGKPFGEGGIGDIYGHQLILLNDYQFNKEAYRFRIQHYMRTDSLKDILAVGLRINKNNVVE